MIKLILWDVDGTLLNFTEAQNATLKYLFEKHKLKDLTKQMIEDYDHINHNYWSMLERKEISKKELLVKRFEDFFNMYLIQYDCAQFNIEFQEYLGETIVFYPNVLETLTSLKEKGIKQYAVTNGTKVAQDKKLSKSGLINIFDEIFISDVIKHEKPSVEFFEPVIKKMLEEDIKKEEVLIVGDSLSSDIKGGNNINVKTVWFNLNNKENHTDSIVDFEIKDIKEILNLIGEEDE